MAGKSLASKMPVANDPACAGFSNAAHQTTASSASHVGPLMLEIRVCDVNGVRIATRQARACFDPGQLTSSILREQLTGVARHRGHRGMFDFAFRRDGVELRFHAFCQSDAHEAVLPAKG